MPETQEFTMCMYVYNLFEATAFISVFNSTPLSSVKECLQFRKDFRFLVGLPPQSHTPCLRYRSNLGSNPIGMFTV